VINVGMRQDNKIKLVWRNRQRLKVFHGGFTAPLKHSIVDHEMPRATRSDGLHQMP
jgi:hypothetical protein